MGTDGGVMAKKATKYPAAVGCVWGLWIVSALAFVCAATFGSGSQNLGTGLIFLFIMLVSGVAALVGSIAIGISRAKRK